MGELLGTQTLAAQGAAGHRVGARGPPQPQINPAGMQDFQGPELFGDNQRRVVRQHHSTGAHPDGLRGIGDMTDQHRGGRTADAFHVVMLGQPEAFEAQGLRMAGIGHAVSQGLSNGVALTDGSQFQQGKRQGCGHRVLLDGSQRD